MKLSNGQKWFITIIGAIFIWCFGRRIMNSAKNIFAGFGIGTSVQTDDINTTLSDLDSEVTNSGYAFPHSESHYQTIADAQWTTGSGFLDNNYQDFAGGLDGLDDYELLKVFTKFGIKQQTLLGFSVGEGNLFDLYKAKLSDTSWFSDKSDLQLMRDRWAGVSIKF